MTPGQRVKYIREEGTGEEISQEEFSNSILISQSLLSRIENDKQVLSEQSAFIIEIIYHFRKEWILKGEGPKKINLVQSKEYLDSKMEEMDKLFRKIEKNQNAKETIDTYFTLSSENRIAVDLIVKRLSENNK